MDVDVNIDKSGPFVNDLLVRREPENDDEFLRNRSFNSNNNHVGKPLANGCGVEHLPASPFPSSRIQRLVAYVTTFFDYVLWIGIMLTLHKWILFIYWLLMIGLFLPVACVSTLFIFIYPTRLLGLHVFNRLEHQLCRMVNGLWVAAGRFFDLTVKEYGDDISEIADERCLFLANHLGLLDHFCLMMAFYDKKSVPGKYLWVIFNIWRFTTLGVMWTAHGNFFINGGGSVRSQKLAGFREHLAKYYKKYDYGWIVMYPEGSRLFLIRDAEQKFCQRNGYMPFRNCAHPRTGAAHSALSVCASNAVAAKRDGGIAESDRDDQGLEYIVDCTLGYSNGQVANIVSVMLGEWPSYEAAVVSVHYRIHRIRPEWVYDETVFRDWLYEQYQKKDQLLDDFYRTGLFPGRSRVVEVSSRYCIGLQLFWLVLFFFHFFVWIRPLYRLILAIIFWCF